MTTLTNENINEDLCDIPNCAIYICDGVKNDGKCCTFKAKIGVSSTGKAYCRIHLYQRFNVSTKNKKNIIHENPFAHSTCAICLEDMDDINETTTIRICKHIHHTICINTWTKNLHSKLKNATCPQCRCEYNKAPKSPFRKDIATLFTTPSESVVLQTNPIPPISSNIPNLVNSQQVYPPIPSSISLFHTLYSTNMRSLIRRIVG
jgi:hypothetical protein